MVDRDIREQFSTWRAKHARPAWVPLFGAVNDAGTWFGGTPSSSTSDVWPECAHCLVPMEFLLQIDLGSLPGESLTPARSGHLQLFYCSTDDGDCPTWEPFSGTEEFRVVTNPVEITYRPEVHAYEEKQVNGWKKVLDYPSPVEHRDLGLIYDYNFDEKVVSVTCSDPMI